MDVVDVAVVEDVLVVDVVDVEDVLVVNVVGFEDRFIPVVVVRVQLLSQPIHVVA